MTNEEADFIGALNMCDEISNEAYKKIMCHCEEQEPCEEAISRQDALDCLTATGLKKFDFILDARDKIKNLPPVTPQQEPVLDKIRTEIEQKQYDFMANEDYDEGIMFGLMLAYQIIDKYKAESEG